MDTPDRAWQRYVEMLDRNRNSSDAVTVDPYHLFKFYGKTVFDFSHLPTELVQKVKRIIATGFATVRSGNVPYYANAICEYCPEPFKVGFICKKYMAVYLPLNDAEELLSQLQALAGIHDDLNSKAFKLYPEDYGQGRITYGGWSGNWGASILKEVKMLAKIELEKSRVQREVAFEFLEAGGHSEKVFAFYKREK